MPTFLTTANLVVFLLLLLTTHNHAFAPTDRRSLRLSSSSSQLAASVAAPSTSTAGLKKELLQKIDLLRCIQAISSEDDLQIDFGVKGGELDAQTRAPSRVNYYQVSDAAGRVVDDILQLCQRLTDAERPTNATHAWGTPAAATENPLHGRWKLLFSTAADATFTKNSKRGQAIVQNVVDATEGTMSNIIQFVSPQDAGTKTKAKTPLIQQLLVKIAATALGDQRVGLQFRYAKVTFRRNPFLKSLYIPVPATFLTRWIVFWSRLFRRGRGVTRQPQAYFDVLYLDDQLRIHKTGQGNFFVQARPDWDQAQGLFRT